MCCTWMRSLRVFCGIKFGCSFVQMYVRVILLKSNAHDRVRLASCKFSVVGCFDDIDEKDDAEG